MQKLLEQIAVTAELMGQTISPTAAAMMAKEVSQYKREFVFEALTALRRESKGRFTLAAVIEQIERIDSDGRPGADEAWAMIPKDEYTSAVTSDEMMQALGVAQPLINDGDNIAARMAFKDAYVRIVENNKRNGIKPVWTPSLGHDKEGREAAMAEAVRLGRMTAQHAISLSAPDKVAPMLQSAGEEKLALQYKTQSNEEVMSRIQMLKNVLTPKGQPCA